MLSPTRMEIKVPEEVMALADGYYATQLLIHAIEYRFFTHVAEGMDDAVAIAAAAATDPIATRMILDGLVALGFLDGASGRYVLRESSQRLVEGKAQYFGDVLRTMLVVGYERWSHLGKILKEGHQERSDHFLHDPPMVYARMAGTTFEYSFPLSQRLAMYLREQGLFPAGGHILDVAAGTGVWSLPLLLLDPEATLTTVDRPEVAPVTRQFADKVGVGTRVEVVAGDLFLEPYRPISADVAILANICHFHGPQQNQRLFSLMHETIKPGGHLIIVEILPVDDRSGPAYPLMFSLNMLIHTQSGAAYTASEYQVWLEAAGFVDIQRVPLTGHPCPVIRARRGRY